MAQRFRKKPVVIEAVLFDGSTDSIVELSDFLPQPELRFDPIKEQIVVETLEGDMVASKGDWIIKGVKGECYPCKPDILQETYELVTY